jgi:hypothetical protein
MPYSFSCFRPVASTRYLTRLADRQTFSTLAHGLHRLADEPVRVRPQVLAHRLGLLGRAGGRDLDGTEVAQQLDCLDDRRQSIGVRRRLDLRRDRSRFVVQQGFERALSLGGVDDGNRRQRLRFSAGRGGHIHPCTGRSRSRARCALARRWRRRRGGRGAGRRGGARHIPERLGATDQNFRRSRDRLFLRILGCLRRLSERLDRHRVRLPAQRRLAAQAEQLVTIVRLGRVALELEQL